VPQTSSLPSLPPRTDLDQATGIVLHAASQTSNAELLASDARSRQQVLQSTHMDTLTHSMVPCPTVQVATILITTTTTPVTPAMVLIITVVATVLCHSEQEIGDVAPRAAHTITLQRTLIAFVAVLLAQVRL
jgi:hypothetical protein